MGGDLNFITLLVVRVARTFRAVQIFAVFVGDAIMLFITRGWRATAISRRARSLLPRLKKMDPLTYRHSRR